MCENKEGKCSCGCEQNSEFLNDRWWGSVSTVESVDFELESSNAPKVEKQANKPYVGQMVHFYTSDCNHWSNGVDGGPYLAFVTQVFDNDPEYSTSANLKVFPPFEDPYDAEAILEKDQAQKMNKDFLVYMYMYYCIPQDR